MDPKAVSNTPLSTIECLTRRHGYHVLAKFIRDTPDLNTHYDYNLNENDPAGAAMRNVSFSVMRRTLPVKKRKADSIHAETLLCALETLLDDIIGFQEKPTAFWFHKFYQSFSDLTHTTVHYDIKHKMGVTILLDLLTRYVFKDALTMNSIGISSLLNIRHERGTIMDRASFAVKGDAVKTLLTEKGYTDDQLHRLCNDVRFRRKVILFQTDEEGKISTLSIEKPDYFVSCIFSLASVQCFALGYLNDLVVSPLTIWDSIYQSTDWKSLQNEVSLEHYRDTINQLINEFDETDSDYLP
jgi:hypothetical protein